MVLRFGEQLLKKHELCTMTVEYVLEVTSVLSNAGMIVSPILEGESILGTKKRRIIMLSDMLLCVSLLKG